MFLQIHFQHPNGSTTFVAQTEIDEGTGLGALREWCRGVAIRHPLPQDCIWMICNESSQYFMRAAEAAKEEA